MSESSKNNNENQQQALYPAYMPAEYQDDEINLIDLWVLLSSYKSLFLKVFMVLILLGGFYSFLIAENTYELTTTIQIGSYKSIDGTLIPIETPEALLSKVTNSIEPVFTKKWSQERDYQDIIQPTISNPKGSDILVIQSKLAEDDVDLFNDYQLRLAKAIIDDHQGIIFSLQANLLSGLAIAQLKLEQLQKPLFLDIKLKAKEIALDIEKIKQQKLTDQQFFGIKKNQFKNTIITAQHTLELSSRKAEVINKRLINLDRTKKILKKNIDELQKLILVAHTNKKRSLSKATELNAMSLLLIDNEIQQNQNRLLTLEERYYVGIENKRSDLQEKLQTNQSLQIDRQNKIAILNEKYKEMLLNNELQIAQQKLAIDKVILSIEQTKFNTANEISKQKQTINELKTTLDNYNKTRMVAAPSISQRPVGMSKKLTMILLVFLAGFIAFVAVLMAIFKDKIAQRRLELKNEQ